MHFNSKFSLVLRKTIFFRKSAFRPFKVIDFGTNHRKRVCDLLLVRHSNLGSILHRFRDIAGFFAHDPLLFHPNFVGVPVAPDRPWLGQPEHKSG